MADKVIRLSGPIHTRLEAMRAVLREMTGRPVTQAETVERALESLTDSHGRGAWLSGEEAGRALEERHRKAVQFVVGELLPHLGESLEAIGFVEDRPVAFVHIAGREPFGVGFPGLRTRPDDE